MEVGAKRGVDVILVQEPRIYEGEGTVKNPGYTIYTSDPTWNMYKKTITYVRDGVKAQTIPRDNPQGHLTTIYLPGHDLHIHNVYRDWRSDDESWIHQRILETKGEREVFCGDFNRIGLQDRQYNILLDFLLTNYPILNSLDVPSRNGVLLDLACSRIQGALAYVDHEADAGSDHLPPCP